MAVIRAHFTVLQALCDLALNILKGMFILSTYAYSELQMKKENIGLPAD